MAYNLKGSVNVVKNVTADRIIGDTAYQLAPWQASTDYLAGDVVMQANALYKRIANGTSGASFNAAEESAWNVVGTGATGTIAPWVSGVYYEIGEVVVTEGRIYRAIVAHTSTVFDTDRANWTVIKELAQNAWATATYYYVDDVVFNEDRIYQANTAHTSGTFNTDRANWDVIRPLMSGQPWSALTYYYALEIVTESDKLYQRIASGTSGATFDATEASAWTPLTSDTEITAWTAATDYVANQLVRQNGRVLQAIADFTSGATFDATEAANWTLIQTAPVTDWVASTYYYANEITWQDPYFLRRLFNGTSGASFDNTEKTNWAKISAETPQVWAPSTRYYGGDLVTYNETLLQRITAGVSQATFNVAEAITWEYVAFQEILDWQSNINYPLNSIVGNGGDRVIQNVGIHVGGASFDAAEAANWRLITPMMMAAWQATAYYYAGELVTENGLTYQRLTSGEAGATFDATEAEDWLLIGEFSTPFQVAAQTKTANYTLTFTDEKIAVDASAGNVTITFPAGMPIGKEFRISGQIDATNTITFAATGGTTIINPSTFTPTASYTMPGSAGQYFSATYYLDNNNLWNLN